MVPAVPGTGNGGGGAIVVVADDASNSVLVAAPITVQLQVQAVLRALDVPGRSPAPRVAQPGSNSAPATGGSVRTEVVGPNAVAYTIQYADLDQLGRILATEVKDISVSVDARTRRLIVTGSARRQEDVARLIGILDQAVAQVMMSTQVVELTESASKKFGLQWNWSPTVQIVQQPSGISVTGSPLLNMLGQLTATIEEGQGRVLANPTVATADGRKATINVGQTLYIPITTTIQGTTTTTLQTVNAGIKLEVTPRIIDERRMLAELNIEVNSLAAFGPGGMPIINSRAVSTNLEVMDGAPIVIGGLISDTTTEILRKVPILGDIPVLGEAFRYREKSRQYSNIVVVIIPRVLRPAGT